MPGVSHQLLESAGSVVTKGRRRASQSLLGQADICLRRAAYDLDPSIRRIPNEAMLCGTGYHAGLEHYYLWRQNLEQMAVTPLLDNWPAPTAELVTECYERIQKCIADEAGTDFVWETSFDETVTRAQQMAHAYFAGGHYWPADWYVVGVEIEFRQPSSYDGWWEGGIVDLAVRQRETGVFLLDDHKSARKPWQKGKGTTRTTNQPAWYDASFEQLTGEKPDGFTFSIMTYDGKFERRGPVMVTDADRVMLEAKKAAVLPLLREAVDNGISLPGNQSSFLCSEKWCNHWAICPFGEGT